MRTWTFFVLVLGILLFGFLAKFPQQLGRGQPLHGPGPIHGDGEGYYAYLPALFLNRDLLSLDPAAYESGRDFLAHPAFIKWPKTNRYLDKYPPGVAVLVTPFFGLAVLISAILGQPVDGYNLVFQFLSGTAALVLVAVGLSLLYKVYRRFFGQTAALLTVLGLLLATNLWHYTVFDSLYSHAFAFFATSLVVSLTIRWYESPRNRFISFLLGISLGLSFLVRNANIWAGLVFLGYGLGTKKAVLNQVRQVARHWRSLVLVGLGLALAVVPQLAYHQAITGHWWVFSYRGEDFNWFDQAWYPVLLSPRRGLLFWTPLFWLAGWGFVTSIKKRPAWLGAVVLPLGIQTFLIASWSQWWFGDGLGHRAFIDGYPLWGFLVAAGLTGGLRLSKRGTYLFVAACVLFNFMMTGWYWGGLLPRDNLMFSGLLQLLVSQGRRFSWLPYLWN